VANLRYLKKHSKTGMYWFRGLVPKELWNELGREISESLRTKDPREVPARYDAIRKKFEAKLSLAREGNWQLEGLEEIARDWIRQHWENNPGVDPVGDNTGAGFRDEHELVISLRAYLAKHHPRMGEVAFKVLTACAVEEHHDAYGGWARTHATTAPVGTAVHRLAAEASLPAYGNATSPVSMPSSAAPFANLMPEARKPFMEHLEAFLERNGITGKTAKSYQKSFERLEAQIGRKPVALVTTLDVEAFYQSLVDTKSDKGGGYLKHDTIYRSISNVRFFYKWAEARHLAHENPARKIIVERDNDEDDEDKRDPYSIDDLNAIFNAPLYRGCKSPNRIYEPGDVLVRDHRFWFPLVALFSGMRLSEIRQMEFEDIIDLNGRPHFSANQKSQHGHTKSTKTRSSVRQVPMHPELIKLGLLHWVEERRKVVTDGRIFPDFRYGNWWNQIFTIKVGVKTTTKVFHSFRHGFRDALRNATQSDEAVNRIMGHFREGTGRIYGGCDLLKAESDVIDGVRYDGLDLLHLQATGQEHHT